MDSEIFCKDVSGVWLGNDLKSNQLVLEKFSINRTLQVKSIGKDYVGVYLYQGQVYPDCSLNMVRYYQGKQNIPPLYVQGKIGLDGSISGIMTVNDMKSGNLNMNPNFQYWSGSLVQPNGDETGLDVCFDTESLVYGFGKCRQTSCFYHVQGTVDKAKKRIIFSISHYRQNKQDVLTFEGWLGGEDKDNSRVITGTWKNVSQSTSGIFKFDAQSSFPSIVPPIDFLSLEPSMEDAKQIAAPYNPAAHYQVPQQPVSMDVNNQAVNSQAQQRVYPAYMPYHGIDAGTVINAATASDIQTILNRTSRGQFIEADDLL